MGKHVRRNDLDRFFTIPKLAEKLIGLCNVPKFKLVIEPSAGDGSFSRQINGCLAFDIDPKHPSIMKQDFLAYEYVGEIGREDILCIGNPPYGVNGSLAIKFIKKCVKIADTVAFILPRSFKKPSRHTCFPTIYHLIEEVDLGTETATLDGEMQQIPVVFQIWENKHTPRPIPEHIDPNGFQYVKKADADFCVRRVGIYAGHAYKELSVSETAHYYIKCDYDVIDILNKVKWPHNNTVGQRSISKDELNKVLNRIIKHFRECASATAC